MTRLKSLLYLALLFCIVDSIAQDAKTDSLKAAVENLKEDTNKVNALLNLSKAYFGLEPRSAIRYSNEAKALSEKLGYQKGIALALKNIGIAYYNQDEYVDAVNYWEESMEVFRKSGDKSGVANIQSNLGAIWSNQGDDPKALDYYLQSLKTSEEIKDTLRILTAYVNIGAVYSHKPSTRKKALDFYHSCLPLAEAIGDNDAIGTATVNIGEIYLEDRLFDSALYYFEKARIAFEGTEGAPYALNDIGKVYSQRGDYSKAISYQQEAFEMAKKLDSKLDMVKSQLGLGRTYYDKGDIKSSYRAFATAEEIAKEIGATYQLEEAYKGLTDAAGEMGDYGNAFKYQTLLISIKDTIYNNNTDKKLGLLQFNFDIAKKEGEVTLLTKDKEIKDQEIKRQRLVKNGFIGGFTVVLLFAGVFFRQRNRISKEKKRSDELLLNILPEETAEELKATGTAKAKSFDEVTVLFTDFKNFTQASERLTAEELVQEINYCYSEFDKIVTRLGIEKIKTIGDAYMCAGGLPVSNTTHPVDVVKAGIEMQQFISKNKAEREAKGQPFFELRLGIHTGPVVAGIVGIKKFAYDIWGDTVNTASRMESSGEIGKVNISGATYEKVRSLFKCVHRGKIQAKNKGEIDMYFVEGAI